MKLSELIKEIKDKVLLYSVLEPDGYWTIYLLNIYNEPLTDVFILSSSHGFIGDKEKHSSLLRHYYESVNPNEEILIESLVETSQLKNMFDVSLYLNKEIFENTYTFDIKNLSDITEIKQTNKKAHILQSKY